MQQNEYRIHCAIIAHLHDAFPQVVTTHAGKARDETHAHFLSKMGYEAGTGDIIWYCDSKFGEMEVKHESKQSSVQKTRQAKVQNAGGYYVIVYSVKEAHDFFKQLGFTPRHEAVVEPDLRTTAEKLAAGVNFFRPPKYD